jgi:hypothetical protein
MMEAGATDAVKGQGTAAKSAEHVVFRAGWFQSGLFFEQADLCRRGMAIKCSSDSPVPTQRE